MITLTITKRSIALSCRPNTPSSRADSAIQCATPQPRTASREVPGESHPVVQAALEREKSQDSLTRRTSQ